MVSPPLMLLEEVLRGVRRPELVQRAADEARRLRRSAVDVRREMNTLDPPDGADPEWWDEQARVIARTLDAAALALERVAHLPPQVDPLTSVPLGVEVGSAPFACGKSDA